MSGSSDLSGRSKSTRSISLTFEPIFDGGLSMLQRAVQTAKDHPQTLSFNSNVDISLITHPPSIPPLSATPISTSRSLINRRRMMQGHLARLGKQVGIDFAFGGKTGNTRDSHRLIQLAKTKGEGMQTKVVEQLFNAYFEANEDITNQNVLISRAVKAGLGEGEVREWMENGKGGPEVDREVMEAQEKFISGVPNFTINGKYEVQGAEEPAAFLQVFGEVKDDGTGGMMDGGNSC